MALHLSYDLSIIIPALDEEENVGPLVEQVEATVRGADPPVNAELIIVDDGSTDSTRSKLLELAATRPWLRVLVRDTPNGQSAAMGAGIAAATAPLIATLDADLQNDPAELPAMMRKLIDEDLDMVQGDRSANRKDNFIRRQGSAIGRLARRAVIGDRVRDTGCSARVIKADLVKSMPLHFKGMHRFFPAYAHLQGARIGEMPVQHRPRVHGTSKYGLGLLNRGAAGLVDLFAVRWMGKRYRVQQAEEVTQQKATDEPDTGVAA